MTLLSLILIIFVCTVVGANNASNVVASLYGSRMMRYEYASVLCALSMLAGAMLEGKKMGESITEGFVEGPIPTELQLGILLITGSTMLILTLFRFPISATQVMIGALIGGAYALNIPIDNKFTVLAIASWYFSLVLATLVSFIIYKLIIRLIKYSKNLFRMKRVYIIGTMISSLFVAYTTGAGIIGLIGSLSEFYFVAPLAAAAGIILFGKRTSRKIGKEMVVMDPPRALTIQFSGAVVTEIFIQLHIPVSVTQAMLGGIIGTSLTKGRFDISIKNLRNLLLSWILMPLLSFTVTFILIENVI